MLSYQRALNLLKNGICIAEIGQSVLELLRSKVAAGYPYRSRDCCFPTFQSSHWCRKWRNCQSVVVGNELSVSFVSYKMD